MASISSKFEQPRYIFVHFDAALKSQTILSCFRSHTCIHLSTQILNQKLKDSWSLTLWPRSVPRPPGHCPAQCVRESISVGYCWMQGGVGWPRTVYLLPSCEQVTQKISPNKEICHYIFQWRRVVESAFKLPWTFFYDIKKGTYGLECFLVLLGEVTVTSKSGQDGLLCTFVTCYSPPHDNIE